MQDNSHLNEYQRRAIATLKRRAEAAKIADALYQQRRAKFRAELAAIEAASKAKLEANS